MKFGYAGQEPVKLALHDFEGVIAASFTPISDVPVRLLPGRRWLAVLGSVGQPRDGNPAASYAMLDSERRELTYCRAPYDIQKAAAAIRNRGLPTWLADRLFLGK
jgi:diadenosine tetraphosphatase ApaH/serine/threonine PP2A family protein phosphatase